MKKTALLIAALLLLAASPAVTEAGVETATTSHLYGTCMDFVYQDETLTTSVYCESFIQGAIDAHRHLTSYHDTPVRFCLPMTVSAKKIIGILIRFINEHPEFIEKPAISTLYYVLAENFPCDDLPLSK